MVTNRRIRQKLILAGIAVAGAALLGLLVDILGLSEAAATGIAGAALGFLVAMGAPYAFDMSEQVAPIEPTVVRLHGSLPAIAEESYVDLNLAALSERWQSYLASAPEHFVPLSAYKAYSERVLWAASFPTVGRDLAKGHRLILNWDAFEEQVQSYQAHVGTYRLSEPVPVEADTPHDASDVKETALADLGWWRSFGFVVPAEPAPALAA